MTARDDWAVGDLALCIRAIDGQGIGEDIRAGSVNTVAGLQRSRDGDLCLTFDGIYHGRSIGYWAGKFRKIHPLTDAETRQAREELGERVVEVVRG